MKCAHATSPVTNALLSLVVAFAVACGSGPLPGDAPSDDTPSDDSEEAGGTYAPFDPAQGKLDDLDAQLGGSLSFDAACEPGERVVVAAVGDLLLHSGLQKQASAVSDRFVSLWKAVADLLDVADITYANLEGATARGVTASGKVVPDPGLTFDKKVYTSYPQFNYNPLLLDDLVATGFDVVSTANNHSLDRRSIGVDRTVDALRAAGLPFTGTRRRDELAAAWYALTEAGGLTIAWLACTYGTNGIPDPYHQVLSCFSDTDEVEASVRALVADPEIDAVIVTPHWGLQYEATPRARQIKLAHRLLEAGALAVVGGHPHVLQPWERYVTADGRETFVLYSLGNFVSSQIGMARRTTIVLYLGLTRNADGEVLLNGARYVPLYMHGRESGVWSVKAMDRASEPTAARKLVTDMLGTDNLQPADEPLQITPACP